MYETRLPGSGGQARGLSGMGGPARGPVDIVLNGAVGMLLVYLAFTVIEPFWTSAVESSRDVKFEADVKVLSEALGRYQLKSGEYAARDLSALAPFLSSVPEDPWGKPYVIDPLYRRIRSGGADAVLGTGPGDENGADDRVAYFRPIWSIRYVVEQDLGPVPHEATVDGARIVPVGGSFLPGTREIAEEPQSRVLVTTSRGGDGSDDLAVRRGETWEWLVTGPGPDREPTIPPPGESVVFSGIRDEPYPLIYRVKVAGGAPERITARPDDADRWAGDFNPAVDPVAGHLAFSSARAEDGQPRICLVPRGRSDARVAIMKDPFPAGRAPVFRADGKSMHYLRSDGRALCTVPVPPKGKAEELPFSAQVEQFVLSPDETQIAVLVHEGKGSRIDLVSLSSGAWVTGIREGRKIHHLSRH